MIKSYHLSVVLQYINRDLGQEVPENVYTRLVILRNSNTAPTPRQVLCISCRSVASNKGPRSFLPPECCTLALCGRLCYLAGQNERKAFKDLLPQNYCCRSGRVRKGGKGILGSLALFIPLKFKYERLATLRRLCQGCTDIFILRTAGANSSRLRSL
jgi:hypothetical protein